MGNLIPTLLLWGRKAATGTQRGPKNPSSVSHPLNILENVAESSSSTKAFLVWNSSGK